ncbi:MAG: TIM barrel protein [Planctomycetota bacterium]
MKTSVCIDSVYEGIPKPEAMARVRQCGIDAVEFWSWWDQDLEEIIDSARQHRLAIASVCTKFISLVDSKQRDDYLRGLEESIAAATRLNCPTLISQVGDLLPDLERAEQRASLIEGLRKAASLLSGTGITLVFEPLNDTVDHEGYYLVRSDEAFEIADAVANDQIKVVFDLYHQQISEGDVIRNATRNIGSVGHFHAAGNPGRNELTRGEMNYAEIFRAIAQSGYEHYIGLEYWPVDAPESGLRLADEMIQNART